MRATLIGPISEVLNMATVLKSKAISDSMNLELIVGGGSGGTPNSLRLNHWKSNRQKKVVEAAVGATGTTLFNDWASYFDMPMASPSLPGVL